MQSSASLSAHRRIEHFFQDLPLSHVPSPGMPAGIIFAHMYKSMWGRSAFWREGEKRRMIILRAEKTPQEKRS